MKNISNKNTSTIYGTLSPIGWDENGKIVKFSIYTFEEEDIIIENYTNFKKLFSLQNSKVIAKGIIKTNFYNEKYIELYSIKKLANPTKPPLNKYNDNFDFNNIDEHRVWVPKNYENYKNFNFYEAS